MPRISIIAPVYKAEKYVHRCIDSILAQTLTDFELILVDDGSQDECGKICDEFAEKDSRIHVIHQINSGVSKARNDGLRYANGDFVTFVDSDDWISNNYLEALCFACEKNNAQIAVCDYAIAESDSKYEIKECLTDEHKIFSNRDAVEFYATENLDNENALFRSPWAKLIKKEIAQKFLFPVDRKYAEDAACVYLWLWNSNKTVHIKNAIYYYYQNEDSVCHTSMTLSVVGNFETEKEWISFFKKNGFNALLEKVCRRYITDCLWALDGLKNSSLKEKKEIKKYLRYGLSKYARTANISVKDNPYYFEIAFPVEMKYYWRLQGIKHKFNRRK